jgi:iron(III) transport system ATP-binding protein
MVKDGFRTALPRARCAGFLVIENVRRQYDGVEALRDVSLTVAPGEVLCLLGASGCGKTTLLRLAAGVEAPDGGRILLDGQEVAGPHDFVPPEKRGVGLVFQDYALFPHMSVLENVMFGLRHLPRADARDLAMRGLKRVALEHYADSYPQLLSGGEQQRVALARALAPRPSVILMDEPFSNLDQRLRESIREETMALLREEGISAVVVTHDPEEAMHIAARFFCDFNEIEAIAALGRVVTPLGTFDASHVPDGPCIVCIRPQALLFDTDRDGVDATITARRFLGRVDRLRVKVSGVEQELHARLRDARAFRPAQKVRLAVDERDVLIFPLRNHDKSKADA